MATHSSILFFTPEFLPGKSHGQSSLGGYSPWVARIGHDLMTKQPPSVIVSISRDAYGWRGVLTEVSANSGV